MQQQIWQQRKWNMKCCWRKKQKERIQHQKSAFDTVEHSILLSSLAATGICGTALAWIDSYLSGRSFQVAWADTQVSTRISACLGDIQSWMDSHHLKLNPGDTLVTSSPCAKNLGVVMDNRLSLSMNIAAAVPVEFRVPGEAQKIDRMMEAYAQHYCQCNPRVFQSTGWLELWDSGGGAGGMLGAGEGCTLSLSLPGPRPPRILST
ncbi:hypothetical protein AAFF_G00432810 [Aldrovandia affinis]|uniref:SEC7 domain-containing protein n=1 Tax=Aldrovandia affinis TaxID=143900 RepID=A0AAD7WJ39_9TELE|nr:hypothetical protein AAFF_G00432810 [Aldrovandia affinis]